MLKFEVRRKFQTVMGIQKEGKIIEASKAEVLEEMKKGFHERSGRPISSLLNHCTPIDAEARALVSEFYKSQRQGVSR